MAKKSNLNKLQIRIILNLLLRNTEEIILTVRYKSRPVREIKDRMPSPIYCFYRSVRSHNLYFYSLSFKLQHYTLHSKL